VKKTVVPTGAMVIAGVDILEKYTAGEKISPLMMIDAPMCLNGTNTSEKAVDAAGKSVGIKTKKGSYTALFSLQLKFYYSFIFTVKLFYTI
tara:strand:+ start:3072 stop:3344 length:273 start_codon:yes stop_codon:yes gene_type:complete